MRRGSIASSLAALAAALPLVLQSSPASAAPPGHPHKSSWTGTWEAAASGAAAELPGQSVRNVIHTSVSGRAVRIRVSNRLGTAPLGLGAVTVALQQTSAPKSPAAVSGSVRTVTFHGSAATEVPAGRDAVSDPVPLRVAADANLLVSLYTPGDSGPATYHRSGLQTSFLAPDGDHTADRDGGAYTKTTSSWYYLTGVDVLGAPAAGSVVTLGDSITDGSGSTPSANHRWPDRLAARLRELPPPERLGVLNAGIAGNRVLLDGTGPSALSRLDADVLSRSGVRALVVMEGINDIKGSPNQTDPAAFAAAYREIVSRAHARGIRVVGGTITPYGGNGGWTTAREAVRQSVNDLIRHGGVFDAVVDFDAVVRDPAAPDRILPDYDSGDHLHFDDAGLQAMADAVDLRSLDHGRR